MGTTSPRPHRQGRSTSARCIRRSGGTSRAPVRSAGWRSSQSCPASRTRRIPSSRTSGGASGGRCRSPSSSPCWRCSAISSGGSDMATQSWIELAPVDAGRPLGGLAVLRALGAVARQQEPEHVDADRNRHRRRVPLQRRRDSRARRLSELVRLDGARRGLLRGRGRHHLADAARPAPRAQGSLADLGGDQVAARPRAQDRAANQAPTARKRTFRSRTFTSAIRCASGPARRCRWTAW